LTWEQRELVGADADLLIVAEASVEALALSDAAATAGGIAGAEDSTDLAEDARNQDAVWDG